jgi:hypothetical protein
MRTIYTIHSKKQMNKRGIPMRVVESVLSSPDFWLLANDGRFGLIASRVMPDNRRAWVTVIVDEGYRTVITVYRSSGFQKGAMMMDSGGGSRASLCHGDSGEAA